MANIEKLLASAQKFLLKGQLTKAIGEYQKIVEAFPKDARHRQKLAELLSRGHRNESALAEYEIVARQYAESGFYLKSIAVFKQMQKIEPTRVDIYHRLAELNEKQGLIGNALTEYRNLVSFYEKDDMHHEAIEVLQKMADLDPDNLVSSAKITQCLMASGRTEEALVKFQAIIESLAEKAEYLKIIKLYERFLELCPEEGTSLLPLATALLKSGSAEEAITVLKTLLKHSPEDPDIHLCLTDAYVANQDFANARLTLKHLLKQKDDLDLNEYYVRICLDAGEVERARDWLEEWKEVFFQAERITVLQGFYEELNALLPGDSVVAETLSFINELVEDTARQNELDVAAKASSLSKVAFDTALIGGAIDDADARVIAREGVPFAGEVPPLDLDAPAKKSATVGLELDLDLDFETAVAEFGNADFISAVTESSAEEGRVSDPEIDEDVGVEVEIDLVAMDDLDLEFDEDIIAVDDEVFAGQDSSEGEGGSAGEIIGENGDHESEFELYLAVESPDLNDAEETDTEEQQLSQDEAIVPGFAPVPETVATSDDVLGDVDPFESFEISERDDLSTTTRSLADAALDVFDSAAEEGPLADGTDDLFGTPQNFDKLDVLKETDNFEPPSGVEETEELELTEDFEALEELEELEAAEEIEELEDVETLVGQELFGGNGFGPALHVETELEDAEFYLHQGLYDNAAKVVQGLIDTHPESVEFQAKIDEINQTKNERMESNKRSIRSGKRPKMSLKALTPPISCQTCRMMISWLQPLFLIPLAAQLRETMSFPRNWFLNLILQIRSRITISVLLIRKWAFTMTPLPNLQ